MWAAFFAAGMAAVYAGFALGVSGEAAVAMATVGAGLALLLLERLAPQQPEWLVSDGRLWQDLGHFVAGFGLGTFLGTWSAQALFPAPVWAIWPGHWPLPVQVVLGLIVGEFFSYWQHRAVHEIPALWPLHALHHSTGRMTFFKTTRIHMLDIGTFTFLSIAPLLAAGAPISVLLWVTALGNFAAQTQHANVRFPTPAWLNAVVGTPSVHWLHHSIDLREGNSNFGMNLMLFDHLFGTYLPPGADRRVTLGVANDPVPGGFLRQLAIPWTILRGLIRRR